MVGQWDFVQYLFLTHSSGTDIYTILALFGLSSHCPFKVLNFLFIKQNLDVHLDCFSCAPKFKHLSPQLLVIYHSEIIVFNGC